jgi:cytochrome P450
MAKNFAPGPKMSTLQILGLMASGQKFDQLAFSTEMDRTFGPAMYAELGPIRMYQFSDPELVREVLVEKADKFHKGAIMKRGLTPILGMGLVTSDGDFWKRQRKLAQPAFHYKRIESYAAVMVDHTLKMLDTWGDGDARWINKDMMKLTLNIVCKTLFDADVSGDAERVGELLVKVMEILNERFSSVVNPPEWIPTPKRLRLRRMGAELDAIIQRFIDERRRTNEDKGDLLSMLMLAEDENGERMSDKQLRDEVMTLFFAGHETTAMTLTWTWYLLSQHPAVYQRVIDEVDAALGGRPATVADLPNLPYSEQVIKESMRLYPAVSGVNRRAIEDVTIGGYTVPKDTEISVATWAMHRSPRYFDNPLQFDPERFSPENEKRIPKYAYLPFAAGPRVCIGNSFAMMESRLILATITQQYRLSLVPGQQIVPEQILTVRPKYGLRMRAERRARAVDVPAHAQDMQGVR